MRRTFHRVDLEGVIKRCVSLRTIQRRKYNVKVSSSLWHIDGNHQLIRLVAIAILFFVLKNNLRESSLNFGLL